MADARSLALGNDVAAETKPTAARRWRALWRRTGRLAQRLIGRRPIEGFVDGMLAGDIRGWAFDPNKPHRRVHVVARCDGQVVGEALADLSRRDLIQDGRGDGRHAFNLKLPAALLDGTPRRIRIEAVSRWGRTRLIGGDILLGDAGAAFGPKSASAELAAGVSDRSVSRFVGQARAALLLWGGDDPAADLSLRDWAGQAWPDLSVGRLGAPVAGVPADAVFGADDGERLRAFVRAAHTVILARAGDRIDPMLARLAVQTRPLGDVVTWDSSDPGGAGRRAEARALGILLGEGVDGLGVRRHVFDLVPDGLLQDLGRGKIGPLRLWLAGQSQLRWSHLPAELTSRPTRGPVEHASAIDIEGYQWRDAANGRPRRLTPSGGADRISLAVWPQSGKAHREAIGALLRDAPDCEIEILALANEGPDPAADWRGLLGATGGDRLSIRPIDPPPTDGMGAWLATLGEAATGQAIVFCHAGVRTPRAPGMLAELAAWSLSPLAGGVTIGLQAGRSTPLTGLALDRANGGWRLTSAYDAARAGQARPVLAAPGAFMVVARAKLAAIGGIDDRRFPGAGADLDLALRLRRMGAASILIGDITATAAALDVCIPTAVLGAFDAAELAAAADAFPVSPGLDTAVRGSRVRAGA